MKQVPRVVALVLLGLFGVAVADRLWRTPDLGWNWAALILLLFGIACALIGLRKPAGKQRWYHLRPGVLAAGCLLLLGAWFVVRIPAPMGDGPAGPPVAEASFKQPWGERPVVLLSMGDSISTGYGAGTALGYVDLLLSNNDDIYPGMRGRDLSSVLPGVKSVKRASNSSNSMAHLRVIESLPVHDADTYGIVCITTGGIDLIHYYGKRDPVEGAMYGAPFELAEPWIRNFEARLDRMVQTLQAKFPGGCSILLATIYDPTDGVGDIENAGPMFWLPAWPDGYEVHTAFNDAIKACAAKHAHVHLADIHAAMLGHGIHCRDRTNPHHDRQDDGYWYWVNLEDPNRRGYDAIRRVFLNAITDALRGEQGFDVPPEITQ
jgi:lysophospholipase L1-like esterase